MAESDSGEKTEEATSKKLEDTRAEGQVAKSAEFTTAAFLLGATLTLSMIGPMMWRMLLDTMGESLSTVADPERGGIAAITWLQTVSFRTLMPVLAFSTAMAVIAVLSVAIQTGGLVTTKPLAPKWSRLNPLENAKRMLGTQAIAQLVRSLAKMGVVGWAVYATIKNAWPDIQDLALQPSPTAVMDLVARYGMALLKNAGMMFLVLAAVDYAWQRYSTAEQLKMTKQEVKEEGKAQEGNQEMKSRRRAIGRDRIRRQMFAQVPKADVVIVNPVHIAIAIKYDPDIAPAPYIVALGQRKVALRIKELAFAHGVPVIENIPLARALIVVAKVGTVIPVEMYLAVAEVLAFVLRQRERYGASWRGTAAA